MKKELITVERLRAFKTCDGQLTLFEQLYPHGITLSAYPGSRTRQLDRASRQGLNTKWAMQRLHLSGRCRKWRDNGQIAADLNYRDGKLHGRCRRWYGNGQIADDWGYVNGLKHGRYRWWHPNGRILTDRFYSNGQIVMERK